MMNYKRFFWVENFLILWVGSDWWFNNLLRTPSFGRYAHFIEFVHFPVYAILGMYVALSKSRGMFLFFLFWCGADEGLQILIPSRVASGLDIVRNVMGYFIGYFIVEMIRACIDSLKQNG